ncbi:MAG: polyprenol monophosphomannose synthase [Ktedonobacterales bacterium]|nr:polyprenol monophosphomannose synthase [Ktedonobacterales bacterium]
MAAVERAEVRSLIVIPTYNERENIASIVEDVLRSVPTTDLLIIDDHSPDGTGQIADELAKVDPRVHALHRPGKLGLGTAYILGFQHAIAQGYDLVFEMDADYSHDPRYLPRFFEMIQEADLVIGSRYVPGGGTPNWSPLRRFISGGGNIFARAVLGIPIRDCTSGYRCYRTAALRTLNLGAIRAQGYAFQVELAYNFWKSGYRVREVPIIFVDRRVGKSKMSRKIFAEAFLWVMRTRVTGDTTVRRPRGPDRAQAASGAPLAERPRPTTAGE